MNDPLVRSKRCMGCPVPARNSQTQRGVALPMRRSSRTSSSLPASGLLPELTAKGARGGETRQVENSKVWLCVLLNGAKVLLRMQGWGTTRSRTEVCMTRGPII